MTDNASTTNNPPTIASTSSCFVTTAIAPNAPPKAKKGWGESQIVIRFWIIALILALIGLATLKLR